MPATPRVSPWSTLLSAPPVYQAKFAGRRRRSLSMPISSISSRKLRSLDSRLIYDPPTDRFLTAGSLPDSTGKFRPRRRDELVECRLLEPTPGERPLASLREIRGLTFRYEGDRASTESRARETCAPGTVLFRYLHESVELGGRDLVVVAQRDMRGVHQAPELVEVCVLECLDRLHDAGILGDDVPGAFQLFAVETVQVLLRGFAQFLH